MYKAQRLLHDAYCNEHLASGWQPQPLPTVTAVPVVALRSVAIMSEKSISSRHRASPHCTGGVTASERSMIVKLTLNALPTDVFEELLNFLRPALK